MDEKLETMVLVRDAVKTYRARRVLTSLSLSVKKQSLYGLLGPSSCGKTTLLNCILAVKQLDSGFINLKVRCSKEIGYMPQELALFENFTMKETFHFYGNFFGMEVKKINKRMYELVEFLGLPECAARPIFTFSGGQKRRVSFAVALFHDPTLLILDEPTVGMDCVLSERIWSYLLKLTTEGKTIIITTHYIQEAKNCDMIGLMRHGQLLVEKSPGQLMAFHQSTNLEEIFLDVCKKQDGLQDAIDLRDKILQEKKKSSKASYRLFPDNNWFDTYRFMALLNKNVLWLRRNKLAASGTAILPLIIVFLYGMVMGKDPKSLKIALLSQEISYDGDLGICNGLPDSYFETLNCTLPSLFTCPFIDELHKRDINIVLYKDYSYIARDIASNKVWGSIEVPQNFTTALINRIENGLRTEDRIVEDGILTSRIDGTNAIIKIILTNHLKESVERFYNNLLLSCGMSEKARIIPMQYNDPLFGLKESAFDQSALPGFLSAFAFYFTLIYTTSAIMMEKVLGLLDRNTAAGMTYFEIVGAHLVVQFVIMLMQNTIMLVVFYIIFGYNFEGSVALAMFIIVTVNCVGISFAFLLTEIFDKELSTAYASIGATVTVFMTGGIIWPQEGMHYMLAALSNIIPVAPVTKGLISIIARNYAITHPSILVGLFSNLIWTIVFTILAYIVHRINKVM
ncbi:unnamed protein product [Nezara viridula]|uniref:ABC transporter domain-containing protein n=1 Tax=Nezara viridula TaxID=85310 RepID=A0A9P0MQ49_NEZVI|nr:unnamed protein product [Nezara viridula]